ncbi:hypothetical protein Ancab_037969 [Ancistrocladus abbreviatus]
MERDGSEFEGVRKDEAAGWDCGSPLYDLHELVSMGFLIERHTMVLPFSLGGSKRFKSDHHHLHHGAAAGLKQQKKKGSSCVPWRGRKSKKGEKIKSNNKKLLCGKILLQVTSRFKWFF